MKHRSALAFALVLSACGGKVIFVDETDDGGVANGSGGSGAGSSGPTSPDGDFEPPVLSLPGTIVVPPDNATGATVAFVATATDAVDGDVPVDCQPTSGSVFPIGETTVSCTASDAAGNTATGSFAVVVFEATPVVRAAATHTCALLSSGHVRCWGGNGAGQIGNGLVGTLEPNADDVVGLSQVVDLAVGGLADFSSPARSCALRDDKSVWCWGNQQEPGYPQTKPTPTLVPGISATAIDVAGTRLTAIADNGSIIQTNKTTGAIEPVPGNLSGVTTISAGTEDFTCASLDTGKVVCWGSNDFGQLGNGETLPEGQSELEPVEVLGIDTATAVSAGYAHACALLQDGTVRCWGRNLAGEAGVSKFEQTEVLVPVTVVDLDNVVEVSAGGDFNCALIANGEVRCWGDNPANVLGTATLSFTHKPVLAFNVVPPASLTTANEWKGVIKPHACAQQSDGEIQCWGGNEFGKLGAGSFEKEDTAVYVVGVP